MNRVFIYAPTVKEGGGFILLKEIIDNWPNELPISGCFSKEVINKISLPKSSNIFWCKSSFIDRIRVENLISKTLNDYEVILSLNNMPPLFKSKSKQVVFLQNIKLSENLLFFKQELKTIVLRAINFFLRTRVSEYIVQTESMKLNLKNSYNKSWRRVPRITVLPFLAINQDIFDRSFFNEVDFDLDLDLDFDFIYPASGFSHKNHIKLLDAWIFMAKNNFFPSLACTINSEHNHLIKKIDKMKADGIKVTNLGWLDREELFKKYHKSKAIIYPSLKESYGLPLVEASILNIPIIASDLEYVYDVCNPNRVFNPNSSKSIARSVMRYLEIKNDNIHPNSTLDFIEYILENKQPTTSSIRENL